MKNNVKQVSMHMVSPHDCSFTIHDLRHRHMDFLAGVESSKRQPDDEIREELLKNLRKKIFDPCENVIYHVNKYIAHAATPESRVGVSGEDAGITLGHLWDAQKHLCEVAGFLSIYVLGGAQQSFLPIPQDDQFQYIERPLIEAANLPALRLAWNRFSEDCNQWGRWGTDAYKQDFGQEGLG